MEPSSGTDKKRGRSLLAYGLIASGLIALMLLLAALAFYGFDQARQEKAALRVSRLNAEDAAARIGEDIARVRAALLRFSRSDELRRAMVAHDHNRLRELEKRFSESGIDDLTVGVFTSEDIERMTLDEKRSKAFGLSFAAASMLRNTLHARRPQLAEVHELKKARAHIGMSAPVLRRGDAMGAIYLSLPLKLVRQPLARAGRYGGMLALQQEAGGVVTVVKSLPDVDPGKPPSGAIEVPGTIWRVAWWPARLADVRVPLDLIAAVFGSLILLSSVLLVLLSRRVSSLLTQDLASLVDVVESMLVGRKAHVKPARLAEVDGTLKLVASLSEVSGSASRQPVESVDGLSTVLGGDSEIDSQLGDSQITAEETSPEVESHGAGRALAKIPSSLVRCYDIRGIAGLDLSADVVRSLGQAIGSEAYDKNQQVVLLARDGRKSGPELHKALVEGLLASGRDVIDLGMVPSPLLYFGTQFLDSNTGVVLTGSHNPPEFNGLKIVIDGVTLSGEALERLSARVNYGDLLEGRGSYSEQDLIADYLQQVGEDIQLARPLKVVVDCGHGVASEVAPALLQRLGCEVIELNCTTDGSFPGHHPDPSRPANMKELIDTVRSTNADVGVAFDGDGDRLGVVDSSGKIIWPDRLLMFLAADVLVSNPGSDVIFDVKSTRHLTSQILSLGGRPIMWKSGHSLLRAKMQETGAMLGGELSGHLFFMDRWYGFDDALYAAARVLELLALDPRDSAEIFAELPESPSTPELFLMIDGADPHHLMEQLKENAQFPGAKLIDLDGLRAEFEDGWGLVRASNTVSALTFRFEARDEASLEKIKDVFRHFLQEMLPGLTLPF